MKDPVRDFLRKKRCPPHVADGGLPGLIEIWEQIVQAVETGYSLTLDDYLNDLDARQLIAEVWDISNDDQRVEAGERLRASDEAMRRVTRPVSVCLWGSKIAGEEGWTSSKNWWYFARPIHAPTELLAEIDAVT